MGRHPIYLKQTESSGLNINNDNNNNPSNFEKFIRRNKIGRGISKTVEKES